MRIKIEPVTMNNDAELVHASLAGKREAFGQIVSRYQSLVCSLAYSATGSLATSQDVAQETFVIAWKQLDTLREPEKLRSWLCGIARKMISALLRRQDREPSHRAEALEEASEPAAPDSCPVEQAISNEEAAMLWRALEKIPEIYREPMVLFYREDQTVKSVARDLDLTEEAVKQRLSRGRKLLYRQLLEFVEETLVRTNPGQAFTLAVLIALPATTMSARAATMGAAAKGSATIKGTGILAGLGAVVPPLLMFVGMWRSYRAEHAAARTEAARAFYTSYYTRLVGSMVLAILICCAFMEWGGHLFKTALGVFAMVAGLTLGYVLLMTCFFVWHHRARRKFPADEDACLNVPGWEYRSPWQCLGLPLIHIRFGRPMRSGAAMMKQPVKAWIAINEGVAFGGLFAYGTVAVAPVSIGVLAVGLISYGAVAAGALAVGGFALGIWAFAGFAFGWQVSGGCAIAWDIASGGQYAIARHFALGPVAHAGQANSDFVRHLVITHPFFQTCWRILPYFYVVAWAWAAPMFAAHWWRAGVVRKSIRSSGPA